jgi:hypothetical protein
MWEQDPASAGDAPRIPIPAISSLVVSKFPGTKYQTFGSTYFFAIYGAHLLGLLVHDTVQ